MSDPYTQRTNPLYQKDGTLYTHTSKITSIQPLSSLPPDHQALFKLPPDTNSQPFILTTPSTIFHAQGGGQPSDTGTIIPAANDNGNENENENVFHVHQVRKIDPTILHLGTFNSATGKIENGADIEQRIDVDKRVLHSRIHTAGHVIGLAINLLKLDGKLPSDLVDGKASHYPGAAFVEFSGLIPGEAKTVIQDRVDDLVSRDLNIGIHFWSEEKARQECTGVTDVLKGDDEDGIRVVDIGGLGSYPCGGTHVGSLKGLGKVVLRGIKRQKGVSKVSYEVKDA